MNRFAGGAATFLVVVAAVVAAHSCGYRAGGNDALARAQDDSTDRRLARFASQQLEEQQAWRHQRDSLNRAAAVQRRRADSLASVIRDAPGDSVSKEEAVAVFDAKDSVIVSDSDAIVARDRKIAQLEAMLAIYRDRMVPELQRERDGWKRKALRHWGCVIGAGGVGGFSAAGNATQSTVGLGGTIGIGAICGLRL